MYKPESIQEKESHKILRHERQMDHRIPAKRQNLINKKKKKELVL